VAINPPEAMELKSWSENIIFTPKKVGRTKIFLIKKKDDVKINDVKMNKERWKKRLRLWLNFLAA
jgi:hypothetical protein